MPYVAPVRLASLAAAALFAVAVSLGAPAIAAGASTAKNRIVMQAPERIIVGHDGDEWQVACHALARAAARHFSRDDPRYMLRTTIHRRHRWPQSGRNGRWLRKR